MVESIQSSDRIVSSTVLERQMRVLHVDDDPAFLKVAKQCLEMQGEIEVDTASSVNEASEKLKKKDYDAVVSDYQMPDKDGLEFLKELRAKGNTVPFIVFTGKGREEIAIKALNLGADAYFNKMGSPETVYGELAHGIRQTVEKKRVNEALHRSESKSRTLLENLPQKVFFKDKNSVYISCNENYARDLKIKSDEIAGRTDHDFHPKELAEKYLADDKRIMTSGNTEDIEEEYVQDGQKAFVHTVKTPVKDEQGNVVGILGIFWDITEHKKAEEEVRKSQRLLEETGKMAKVGGWELDLSTNEVSWTEEIGRIHGVELGYKPKLKEAIEFYAPESIPVLKATLKKTMETGEPYDIETLFIPRGSKDKIWVRSLGKAIYDGNKIVKLAGTFQDIDEYKKAEEALHESIESYKDLTESISDMFFAMDKDFRYTYWNKASEKFTGISAKDAIGKSLTEVFPDTKGTRVEQFYKEALRTKQPQSYLNKYQLGGKDYVFEINAYPTKTGLSVFVKDVTERKKEEHAFLESKQKLERLFESIPQATASVDVNDCVLDLNPRFSQLFGYSAAEAKGKPLDDLIVPNDKKKEAKMLTENSKEGYVLFETVRKTKDGSLVPVSISAAPVSVEGQHVGDMVLYQDITGRKQTEEAIRKSEEKFRNLFDSANDAIMYLDRHGRILDVNGRAIEIFGGKREELIGKHFTKIGIFSIKEIPMLMRNFANIFAGKRVNLNVSVKNKKGQEIALDCSASLMKTDESAGIVVIARDISERLKAEEELRNSEARLNVLFELAPDAYYLNDLKGNFIDGNKAAEEVTGYTKNELIGKSFLKLKLLPRSQALKAAKLLAINAFGKPTGPDEFVLNRKDGTQVPVEIRTHPAKIKGKTLVLGIARDITTRKKDEQAILESQQKFAGLFKHNPEASVYLDLDFKVLDVNPRFCELFGYSAEEVEGKWINEVVTPEDMIEEAERLDKDAKKGYASLDTVRKRKDGSLVHVSISAAPLTIEGRLFGYVGVYKDITDLKNVEERLKEMNKRLEVMNEKLYVVGGLTRHDVRNKLSAVTGNAYLLRRKLTEDPKALEQLKDIEAAVRLVEEIFEFARNYEKLGAEKLAYMDVGKAVEGAVSLFSDLKGVKVVNECGGLTVLADSLLRQLFYNLIDNSLKYGEKTRQIKIHYNTLNADQLELVYEDDGVGIPDNMRSNLFKEGFTSGKGTGYGLFMIKRIIEVYGWNIQETGIQGKGVKFVITISKTDPSGKENYLLDRER